MYHCAPAIAEFTAERKRVWAQKVFSLAQRVASQLPGYDELFDDSDAYDTNGSNTFYTCVLAPEVKEGPSYHTVGYPFRQNITELQDGLLLLLDIGVVNVETCKPLPNILVDIWQANATGHYAGHPLPVSHLMNEEL
ncbi:Intradiol ring-cleavage dioxygenase [Flagelloscypha sp. PMI_526]|nr:Intradiol ring-cleavage dioxygenase [Flagelloscypha sp. PMI_526]